jgi:hypothetical protein
MDKKDKQQVAKTEICTLLEKTSIPTNSDQDHQQPPTSNISRLEQKLKAPKIRRKWAENYGYKPYDFPDMKKAHWRKVESLAVQLTSL